MPKISRHGGASYDPGLTPDGEQVKEPGRVHEPGAQVPSHTPPPGVPGGAAEPAAGGVPTGSANDVLAWITKPGADSEARARAALEVEREKDSPRVTLVRDLEKVAGAE